MSQEIKAPQPAQEPWRAVYIGCGDWDIVGPATEADYVLAAAAPELLEALLQVFATFSAPEGPVGTGRFSFPANGNTADLLRAAIAKATGAQP